MLFSNTCMSNCGGQSLALESHYTLELIVMKLFGEHGASKSRVLSDARHCLDVGPNIFLSARITSSPGCGDVNNIRVAAKYKK